MAPLKAQVDALTGAAAAQTIPEAVNFDWPAPQINRALCAIWTSVRLGADLLPVEGGTTWRYPSWRAED